MKNWIAVASAAHARRGREGGYMQVCHGKLAPIRRVHPGDRVAYYAPTITMGGKDTCHSGNVDELRNSIVRFAMTLCQEYGDLHIREAFYAASRAVMAGMPAHVSEGILRGASQKPT